MGLSFNVIKRIPFGTFQVMLHCNVGISELGNLSEPGYRVLFLEMPGDLGVGRVAYKVALFLSVLGCFALSWPDTPNKTIRGRRGPPLVESMFA